MKKTNEDEVKRLYYSYGVNYNKKKINNTLNKGNLNKKLNCDFSNVFGKSFSNNYSNTTSTF